MHEQDFRRVTEVQISYHNKVKAADRPSIRSSQTAEAILRGYWSNDMQLLEEFNILLLDRSNRVLGFSHVSRGGTSGTVVDAKILFATALRARASQLILAHNHPSGNLRPSDADKVLTRKLCKAGQVLELPILDHLILSPEGGFFSFADNGLIEDF